MSLETLEPNNKLQKHFFPLLYYLYKLIKIWELYHFLIIRQKKGSAGLPALPIISGLIITGFITYNKQA